MDGDTRSTLKPDPSDRIDSPVTPSAQVSSLPEELLKAVNAITSRLGTSPTNSPSPGGRRPLKFEYLVTRGFITREQLAATTVEARDQQRNIDSLLMLKYEIPKNEIGLALSLFYRCPFVPADQHTGIATDLLKNLSAERLARGGWIPLKRDGTTVTILTKDPYDLPELDAIAHFFPGDKIKLAVGFQEDIGKLIDGAFQAGRTVFDDIESRVEIKEATDPDEVDLMMDAGVKDSDSTIIRLANQIIEDAHRDRASDIHVEPCSISHQTIIRFRVDGSCFEYQRLPAAIARPLGARLKIMAGLDIAERRKPQDGKIRARVSGNPVELRVATIPTIRGNEDVVLRLLPSGDVLPIEEQGMSERNLRELLSMVHKPAGLLLCVGPTGSGKTTALHALLNVINTTARKIWTAEDPVEITQAGLRQVQVRPKIGLSFAAVMRAFLRGDPDVIMVGEIRDGETASIAVEASLTGHLVFSTLHTNSAVETVVRLLDLGVDAFNFSDALLGVLAQRLVKRLCGNCREPYRPDGEEMLHLINAYGSEAADIGLVPDAELSLYRARGCQHCRDTGYRGRLAIHELLVASAAVKDRIYRRERVSEVLVDAKKTGMTTLIQDGVSKVLQGLTDLRAVVAVAAR
jgi:type II secretory ATPase GspE/PulE/Tfp pilus assembly ATPase PilB-like protein